MRLVSCDLHQDFMLLFGNSRDFSVAGLCHDSCERGSGDWESIVGLRLLGMNNRSIKL